MPTGDRAATASIAATCFGRASCNNEREIPVSLTHWVKLREFHLWCPSLDP